MKGATMKFRVERDVLADAVTWTARTLPTRPPVPVLAGVRLEPDSCQHGYRWPGGQCARSPRNRISKDVTLNPELHRGTFHASHRGDRSCPEQYASGAASGTSPHWLPGCGSV